MSNSMVVFVALASMPILMVMSADGDPCSWCMTSSEPDITSCGVTEYEGWTLARAIGPTKGSWFAQTDGLFGDAPWADNAVDQYNIGSFSAAVPGFNQFLFVIGDCSSWLITSTDAVGGRFADPPDYYSAADRTICASSFYPDVYTAKWYYRSWVGSDPWIGTTDHDTAAHMVPHQIVYGENSYGHAPYVYDYVYVYIRSVTQEANGCINTAIAREYKVGPFKGPQSDASQWCADNYGTELATLTSDADRTSAVAAMNAYVDTQHPATIVTWVWIGLNDKANRGTWIWQDGTDCPWVADGSDNCENDVAWSSGEPTNGAGEDCAYMGLSKRYNDCTCAVGTDYPWVLCNFETTSNPSAAPTNAPSAPPSNTPTMAPSTPPTNAPSASPTLAPSAMTSAPSGTPSKTPTAAPLSIESETCPISETATFDWDTLTKDGTAKPIVSVVMDVNSDDLSLNIDVEVQYIVNAFADYQPAPNFGTTYVLDFEDFDAHKSSIALPGSCSNRLADSYVSLVSSDDYFRIGSEGKSAIGTTDNMCYPPSDGTGWDINSEASTCQIVKYEGKWTWNELRNCRNNGNGAEQTFVDNSDENWLTLSGTFYVNMVSPYWYENNHAYGDFYRVYQLWSQPFVIQVSQSVYVIGDTDINVMTMSVIAVYKENQDSDYTLVLLTETAEYMQLANAAFVSYTGPGDMTAQFATLTALNDAETGTANENCLNNKGFICSQLWKVFATDTSCDSVGGTVFSGTYRLKFDPQCRTGNGAGNGYDFEDHCDDWLTTHDTFNRNNNGVLLQSDLVFVDSICDPTIFTVQLAAEMTFYENADYTGLIGTDSPHLYQVGVDTVYVAINVTFPSETESIFESTLVNVWLCTFAPNTAVSDPSQNGPNTDDYVNADNGGCFSADRDGFGDANSDFFFHIYGPQSGIASAEGFVLGASGVSEEIRFSFTVPNEIERDTLYVHAQVEVTLEELPNRRRRMLLDASVSPMGKTANKMSHFGEQIGISKNKPKTPKREVPNPDNGPNINVPSNNGPISGVKVSSKWVMIIAALLSVVLVFNIALMCYMNCCRARNGRPLVRNSFSKNRRNGYDSVKDVDSEQFGDSEVNLIEYDASE